MLKRTLTAIAAVAVIGLAAPALAQHVTAGNIQSLATAFPSGPDHGMPDGTAGGDGAMFGGAPNLQVASSLVGAGPERFRSSPRSPISPDRRWQTTKSRSSRSSTAKIA